MTETPATLTKSAFAEYLGLKPSYISALVKAGRLVLDGEGRAARVKVAESLALIEATTAGRFDVARRHAAARARRAQTGEGIPQVRSTSENGSKRDSDDGDSGMMVETKSRIDARARKEIAQADQEEMKAAQMARDLTKVDFVKAALGDAGATVRALCDVYPDQHAAPLSAMSDISDVHAYLSETMRGFLIEFCAQIESLEEKIRASSDA